MGREENPKKLEEYFSEFYDSLKLRGYSKNHIFCYGSTIRQFITFASRQLVFYPHEVRSSLFSDFQDALYKERDFKERTVRIYANRIKEFLRYLARNNVKVITDFDALPKSKPKEERLRRYYTFEDLLKRYIAIRRKWISYSYSNQLRKHLTMFFRYLRIQGIKNVYSVTEGAVLKYRDFLWSELKEGKESAIVAESQIDRLRIINDFFKFLYRERIIEKVPCFDIDWKAYFKRIREEAKTLLKPDRYRDWVPHKLKELIQKFINYELQKGKSLRTVDVYKKTLKVFFDFLDKKGISSIEQVTKRTLLDYYTYLVTYKGIRGKGISGATRAHLLFSVKTFFRFLARFDFISKDPTHDIEPIKEENGLPKDYMDEKEMLKVLDEPNINNTLGLRDRAIMEVLFSSGIRKNELCHIDLKDIDYHEGMLRICYPKGGSNYQRVIPIGDMALSYIKLYIERARPQLENGEPTQALFISKRGHRISKDMPLVIVKKYSYEAGIRKNITVHSFRVSCATLMLKNKAGLRHVQEQLGHRRITSTQVYTRLCPLDLKEMHRRCHPRENKE